jgi:hypothetical protein
MNLPPKLCVEDFPGADYAGRWKAFLEAIYQVFLRDVAYGGLKFRGKPVKCRYHEPYESKHYSFWHLMSEGGEEAERAPDLERCARIPWIASVIQNAGNAKFVRWWENERSSSRGVKTHVPLWLVEHDYVVILEKRPDFYLLITTYCLRSRQIEKFEKEWMEWTARKGRGHH